MKCQFTRDVIGTEERILSLIFNDLKMMKKHCTNENFEAQFYFISISVT